MPRTKEFDTDQAIDQALEVFWVNGYERASLSLLTEATGLHKGSLYGAFQSKENLFSLCLDRYVANSVTAYLDSGKGPKQYIEEFFANKLSCSKSRKAKGCLLLNSCVELANAGDRLDATRLKRLLVGVEKNLYKAVLDGIDKKELPSQLPAVATAQRLLALAFTIEELGKVGKDRDFLRNVANGILKDLKIEI